MASIQNKNDNECFVWSVLAAFHLVEQYTERVTNYMRYHDTLKLDGLTFPVKLKLLILLK